MNGVANRLAFADLLRGLAAFVVVIGHFTIVYGGRPDLVAQFTMAEPIPVIPMHPLYAAVYSKFNAALVGLAAFFLISGFVIPMSLDRETLPTFFIRRFFRIFPTYWVALGLGLAAIFISAAFWNKPVTHSGFDYFANALLIADFFGKFDILSVIWTLEIEIKFYLLAPLFHATLRRGSLAGLFAWGVGLNLVYGALIWNCSTDLMTCWGTKGFVTRFIWEFMFITFMLIGTVIYAHYRGLIGNMQALAGVAVMLGCFVISGNISSFQAFFEFGGFAWALGVFGALYVLRDHIRLSRPFRFLADVSYPLYVVHPLVGYVVMRLSMQGGAPYWLALPFALAAVLALAWVIHFYVEAPSMAYGKRLGDRLFSRRSADVPEPG
jgi:peptidoglycan/LPS O-acetylase OafA/YrhL